jgi:hypothetical protein
VIDYALARRATLADLSRGVVSRSEIRDAHPDLLRAARFHGEPTDKRCPLGCSDARRPDHALVHVTYVYGDELGDSSGRARAWSELTSLAQQYADLRVFVVEVCRGCSWNHLSTSFGIGTGEAVRRPARRRAAGR